MTNLHITQLEKGYLKTIHHKSYIIRFFMYKVLYVFKMHVKNGKKPTFNESALNGLLSIFTVIYNKLDDLSSII